MNSHCEHLADTQKNLNVCVRLSWYCLMEEVEAQMDPVSNQTHLNLLQTIPMGRIK